MQSMPGIVGNSSQQQQQQPLSVPTPTPLPSGMPAVPVYGIYTGRSSFPINQTPIHYLTSQLVIIIIIPVDHS